MATWAPAPPYNTAGSYPNDPAAIEFPNTGMIPAKQSQPLGNPKWVGAPNAGELINTTLGQTI